jgi:hypothetical protein
VDRHRQGQVEVETKTADSLTHTIPKTPDADAQWLKGISGVNYYNFISQKGTKPSKACSEGHFFCCYMPQWCFFDFWSIN